MITASLKNYRISPRKARIVADMVKGKKVSEAKAILDNVPRKAAGPLSGLIDSAVANSSHNFKISAENLFVKELRVDQGYTLKRSRPMSRGSAFPIKKRTSNIIVVLSPLVAPAKAKPEHRKPAKAAKAAKK